MRSAPPGRTRFWWVIPATGPNSTLMVTGSAASSQRDAPFRYSGGCRWERPMSGEKCRGKDCRWMDASSATWVDGPVITSGPWRRNLPQWSQTSQT